MTDSYAQCVLRSLERGELSGLEAREAGRVALEALQCIETMSFDERADAVTQVVAGHEVDRRDAETWHHILEAAGV
jgi:hypothetical protein